MDIFHINNLYYLMLQQYYKQKIYITGNQMDQLLLTVERSYHNFSFTQYCSSGSYQWAVAFSTILGTLCFILSKIFNQYSWIDRVWSILPIIYAANFLYFTKNCLNQSISFKQWIMFSFICTWGLRLTYNFYRKGGYSKIGPGAEDYRWQYIRQNYPKIAYQLLNFFFTSYYQIYLILWFSTPINVSRGPINQIDLALFALWILFFAGEVIADRQQWNYQNKKYELLSKNGNNKDKLPQPYKRGFITSGLWTISRHPNFFCEISMWWVMGLIGINSAGFNYTIFGALLLNLLFLGSTTLTEMISSEKYPLYAQYKKTTSMLIPFLKFPSKEAKQKLK